MDSNTSNETHLTVFLPDIHVPYEDKRALAVVLRFISDVKPVRLVNLGDLLDLGMVSRFLKDPREKINLQVQVERGMQILDMERDAAGKDCYIVFVEGNHETRLQHHLMRNDPELLWLQRDGVDVISVPFLLGLKRRRIRWVPMNEKHFLHGWSVEHGDISSQHSAYTAKRMVEKRRKSVVMGHTHKLGTFFHTGIDEEVSGVECGCLIDRESAGASYTLWPNWQLGFAVGEYDPKTKEMQVTPIKITNGQFIYGGRVYR